MNEQHVSPSEVQAFLHGRLAPERVLSVGRHLAQCSACAQRVTAEKETLTRQLLADDDFHLDAETELFPYIDGTADAIAVERIEEHLAVCGRCRADADDLRQAKASMIRTRRVWPYVLAAAAALAAMIFIAPLVRRGERPHRTLPGATLPSAQELAWRALVDDAARNGIAMPAILHDLAPRRGTLRGGPSAADVQLSPRGTVVEETRPVFTWPAVPDARYRVVVFDGARELTSSPMLDATRWQPGVELARGRSYVWQLQVITPSHREIVPAAAEGPARVHVLDAASAAALQEARARRPGDHLLLGILCARAGVMDTAESELSLAARTDARATSLLAAVRNWRSVAEPDQHV